MSELSEHYQDVIQFHNDFPVNFIIKERDISTIEAYNPFCGDQYFLSIVHENQSFQNISFHGHGCALSKASTSILMQLISGASIEEFVRINTIFQKMLQSSPDAKLPDSLPEELHVFEGVRRNPTRHTCATLSWTALYNQLKS